MTLIVALLMDFKFRIESIDCGLYSALPKCEFLWSPAPSTLTFYDALCIGPPSTLT